MTLSNTAIKQICAFPCAFKRLYEQCYYYWHKIIWPKKPSQPKVNLLVVCMQLKVLDKVSNWTFSSNFCQTTKSKNEQSCSKIHVLITKMTLCEGLDRTGGHLHGQAQNQKNKAQSPVPFPLLPPLTDLHNRKWCPNFLSHLLSLPLPVESHSDTPFLLFP